MIFIWRKLKMSYHTAYPNCDCPAVVCHVCHLFLYSFICAQTTAFTWLSKFCTLQLPSVFYLSWELCWCRVSFLKGDLQFSKLFKNTICIGVCTFKCTEKHFIPFTPLNFLPEFVPHTEFKGSPEYVSWNVLCYTYLRNYASFSLQVPSILSILLGCIHKSRDTCMECHHSPSPSAIFMYCKIKEVAYSRSRWCISNKPTNLQNLFKRN